MRAACSQGSGVGGEEVGGSSMRRACPPSASGGPRGGRGKGGGWACAVRARRERERACALRGPGASRNQGLKFLDQVATSGRRSPVSFILFGGVQRLQTAAF